MNKKNKKEKISDALAEGVVELILTIVLACIGFIICLGVSKIFSFKLDELDPDTFILIGIAGLVVIVLVVAMIKTLIKRAKDKINWSQESFEDSNES